MKSELGVIGLGVMGSSLARNFARQGFNLSIYNQFRMNLEERVAEKLISIHPELSNSKGFEDLKLFVVSLKTPRVIVCMIPAGDPMDSLIDSLTPLLSEGDILMDCGNSHYQDTARRQRKLSELGIQYLGIGVSGGEEGALNGPSIMIGGSESGYELVKNYLERISARDKSGGPCCARIGHGGSGHFVKMVHNGIEYAEMQLLAEVYGALRWSNQMSPNDIANLFEAWLETDVSSYLLEITKDILRKKESENWLIDLILDTAENKGTGSWTTIASAELGAPVPTIAEALFARYTSSYKELRGRLDDDIKIQITPSNFSTDDLLKTYRLARISNHHQGFNLITMASDHNHWEIGISTLARIWTNGCIIRSTLMETLALILKKSNDILLDSSIQSLIKQDQQVASAVVGEIIKSNVPIPALSSSIIFLQAIAKGESYGNLIQAQRDYFGAHGYQRVDDPLRNKVHTNWKE